MNTAIPSASFSAPQATLATPPVQFSPAYDEKKRSILLAQDRLDTVDCFLPPLLLELLVLLVPPLIRALQEGHLLHVSIFVMMLQFILNALLAHKVLPVEF